MKAILLSLLLVLAAFNAGHGEAAGETAGETAVRLPASSAETRADTSDTPDTSNTLQQLRALLDGGWQPSTFLAVDDAFQLEISEVAPNRLESTFTIADGYYLYRDKIAFRGEGDARLATVSLPPGEMKHDAYFGDMAVFKHDFSAAITLRRDTPAAAEISLHATYQGCAEDGICYAPVSKTFSVALPAIISSVSAQDNSASALPVAAATVQLSGILLGAFLAGLLLTFTPCVLPMLPILSALIAGHGEQITKRKGGALALVYVLGSMLTYAAIGAIAGATGEQLQAYFQNAWAIGIFAAVLGVMALSLFGFFTIQIPSFIQSKWQKKTHSMGGSLPLVFVFGAVSAIIVGACVSPILISFLGLAIINGDPWLGAGMMVIMAFGMGIPLLALGFGAGHLLPRVGKWMQTVNHIFGVMLIAVAIYLLGALPALPVLLLWGIFFILVGVYLIQWRGGGAWQRYTIGAIIVAWGAASLLGGFFGERDPLRPLPRELFVTEKIASEQTSAQFIRVNNLAELEHQFARASADGKLVMVEFYADWCVDCVRMEKTTFREAGIRAVLQKNFVSLKIDVTDPREQHGKALKKRLGVFGPPAVLFFDRNGDPLADKHFYGYRNHTDFRALIEPLLN